MSTPVEDWVWFGQPGHFCAADRCRYHLHTHVGGYCISTVGEYYVLSDKKMEKVNIDSYYETMVFKLDRKRERPVNHTELAVRRTNDRDAAQAAHIELCREYANK